MKVTFCVGLRGREEAGVGVEDEAATRAAEGLVKVGDTEEFGFTAGIGPVTLC